MSASQVYLPVDAAAARSSAMADFASYCGRLAGRDLQEWPALQQWTLAEPRRFWRAFVDWSQIEMSGDPKPSISSDDCEIARFFPNATLNYARNLLRGRNPPGKHASRSPKPTRPVASRHHARRIASAGRKTGAWIAQARREPGDRVVGIVRNSVDAYAAALASRQ